MNAHMLRKLPVVATAAVLLLGCKGKDPTKCAEAQDGTRKSAQAQDSGLVEQWRARAYQYCEAEQASALDQEVQKLAADRQAAENAKLTAKKENEALAQLLSQWAASHANDASLAAAAVTCSGDAAAEKSKERWCVRTRKAGTHDLAVQYWEKAPEAARFYATLPQPITCQTLGGSELRKWTLPSQPTIQRSHCTLPTGLQALVTGAQGAPLQLFTAAYLEHNSAFAAKLTGEGK